MRIDVLTLFPDMFQAVLDQSIIGRAQDRGYLVLKYHNIRDYTKNKQMQVDDYPYGGGEGMIIQADPLFNAWEHACSEAEGKPYTIYMTPQGKPFTQNDAKRLSKYGRLMLVCGHYEGIDERFIDECVDEEISLGDFVLTGGEVPAMAVCDAVCRLMPGVLASEDSFTGESHWSGLLEYPQYSRPEVWHGRVVPDVLLSGHHENIRKWRRKESILRTMQKRPDMYAKFLPDKQDRKLIDEIIANKQQSIKE